MTGRICGTGSCVPSFVMDNNDIAKLVDTSDEWIFSRSGMRERRMAGRLEQHSAPSSTEFEGVSGQADPQDQPGCSSEASRPKAGTGGNRLGAGGIKGLPDGR